MAEWFARTEFNFAIVIGFFPVLLHIFDKLLEFAHPIRSTTLHGMMLVDSRIVVRESAENKDIFKALATYFQFRADIHLVFVLYFTSLLSVYLGQVPCSGTATTIQPMAIVLEIIILMQVFSLLILLVNRRIDPARVDAAKIWKILGYSSFAAAIMLDVRYHVACGLPHH